eukprot:CAMPEP_0177589720 /NCGR_PEP_ID=MMETSP0419_2-20121207/6976_1 /TAXON_ID=582737 /ORGANISM="Tetraselmis sp., Strain GSL018" /LENGTH=156 /DNA_ID=CAMNT_0019080137 /DNA_START=711 /DNA_END=1177 /DNA_ORIENTATION=+
MEEGASCTTFARRFSARYTHAGDSPAAAAEWGREPAPGGSPARGSRDGGPFHEAGQEEVAAAAAHQLRAAEDVEEAAGGGGLSEPEEIYEEQPQPKAAKLEVSPRDRAEIRRMVQAMVSFVERSHGLRLVGMVLESVRGRDGAMLLLAVHATQWDT